MSLTVAPNSTVYARVEWGVTGLVGTLRVRVTRDSDDTIMIGPQTTGIEENPGGSGNYKATFTAPATAGQYSILWDNGSTTPGNTSIPEELIVAYSAATSLGPTGNDLCTVAQVKEAMETGNSASDTLIQSFITRASADLEDYCQRQFSPYGTQTYTVRVDKNLVDLAPYDLRSPTTVVLRDPNQAASQTLATPADYVPRPAGGWAGMATYTQILLNLNLPVATYLINYGHAELVITGTWGAATVIPQAQDACIKTVCSWLDRAFGQYALTAFESSGRDIRPNRFGGYAIPTAAKDILASYTRDLAMVL